jgi:type IV pilus assembly protein PilP
MMRAWPWGAWLLGLLSCLACDDPVVRSKGPAKASPAQTGPSDAAAAPSDGGVRVTTFQEGEFGESERSRDPFRTYARDFADEARESVKSQRQIVLDKYAVDELKLVGIVTRIHPAKAMVVDPTGKGHVIQRGQFIGRPEVVSQSGPQAATYEVNWRVDRIREGDIVLVREDPAHPDLPTATRVIPLRPDGSIVAGQD